MASDAVYVGRNAKSVTTSPTHEPYTGVRVVVGSETEYEAGDMNGNVLEFETPWGTQEVANNVLASIVGFAYQPYTAKNAIFDAAAELGDGVSINGLYSGIYTQDLKFGPMMAADITAPQGNDVDHEYPYTSKTTRKAAHELEEIRASLIIQGESIEAKVSRTGGSSDNSFGWTLTDDELVVSATNSTVLRATKEGLEITGTVTATNGTIGGCTITNGILEIGSANISSINADTITAGTLSVDRISSGSITGSKIAEYGITSSNIGTNAVVNRCISSGSVYTTTLSNDLQDVIANAIVANKITSGVTTATVLKATNFVFKDKFCEWKTVSGYTLLGIQGE